MDFISRVPYSNRFISSLCAMEIIQGCLNQEEIKIVKKIFKENFSLIVHPDEKIAEKALFLLERYAQSDGLRTVDALIASSALIVGASFATANFKHFKNISNLHILKFRA